MYISIIIKTNNFLSANQIWVKTCVASRKVHIYYISCLYLHCRLPWQRLPWKSLGHLWNTIFSLFSLLFLIKLLKKQYIVKKKLRDYSVLFILTNLIAVYFCKASMLFFGGVGGGSWAGQRPTERQKCPKTMFSKNWPFLRLTLTSFAVDVSLNVLHLL